MPQRHGLPKLPGEERALESMESMESLKSPQDLGKPTGSSLELRMHCCSATVGLLLSAGGDPRKAAPALLWQVLA